MRILFITASRIGDAVLSTGILAHLADQYPHARFTIACGPAAAGLFTTMPFVDQVIPMVKRKRAGHWRDLWLRVATTWWSLVVDLRGSALAYVVPTWHRRVLKSSWAPRHRLLHLAGVLGLDRPQPPRLWASADQEAQAAALLPAGGPILALGPSANWGAKQWPAASFAALANRLTAAGMPLAGARVAVFGAASERASVVPLFQQLDPAKTIDLMGAVDLAGVYACLKRASLYVGNDSGLMHMAAAASVPTLGLFGPSSEVFYGPFGANAASVRGPRGFEDICHAADFDHRSQACLMNDLTVDRVEAAALALLARPGPAP